MRCFDRLDALPLQRLQKWCARTVEKAMTHVWLEGEALHISALDPWQAPKDAGLHSEIISVPDVNAISL
jgi:hypothetical protein